MWDHFVLHCLPHQHLCGTTLYCTVYFISTYLEPLCFALFTSSIPNTPYLGVTLSTDLKFNIHLNKKIRQIIPVPSFCPSQPKILSVDIATSILVSLIRSKLEYSSSVWDPHLRTYMHQQEMVQRRAARFNISLTINSSESQMLKDSTYHPWKTEET